MDGADDTGRDDGLVPVEDDGLEPVGGEPVFVLRGVPVMLDARVAAAFGVETRAVNQAAARNPAKFTEAHRFQLSDAERAVLTSQGVIPKAGRGGARSLPYAYTQKGVARLATILDTPSALAATDRMIDLCTMVYQQIALGRTSIEIAEPTRHVPDRRLIDHVRRLRERLYEAVADLLETPIRAGANTTVADEIGETAASALDMLKAHLKSKSLENEKVAAETLLILEKAREVRDRTRADVDKTKAETERIHLDNIDKRLTIAERAWTLAEKIQLDPVAVLNGAFAEPRPLVDVARLPPAPTQPQDPDA